MRTYHFSKDDQKRDLLTVHASVHQIPFAVWRDLGRLAGSSYTDANGHCVFCFLVPNQIERAKQILNGGLFEEVSRG